jgi:hypothetical protein
VTFKRWAVLQSLLRSYHDNHLEKFEKFLPEEGPENFSNFPVDFVEPSQIFSSSDDKISSMHYSWLLELVKNIPAEQYSLFLSSLPEEHSQTLSSALNQPFEKLPLTKLAKKYLKHYFQERFFDENEFLPAQFLRVSEFRNLLTMEKRRLIQLIGYLGIWDLAFKLKELNHQKLDQSVEAVLSSKKKEYLKICLQEGAGVSLSTIELEKWDGDKRKLEYMLHQRGIERLAHTLSGEHKSFLWHLSHKLDTGRGTVLLKHYSEEQNPELSVLAPQLLTLVEFLSNKIDEEVK